MYDEYIEFDTTPTNESCAQLSETEDYMPKMREEANQMIALLNKKFPNAPGEFAIKRQSHDFGAYLEIRYYFDSENGWDSANIIESNWPLTWKDDAPVRI